jgi:hypothetical protein
MFTKGQTRKTATDNHNVIYFIFRHSEDAPQRTISTIWQKKQIAARDRAKNLPT